MPKLSQRQIQGQNSRDKLLDAATRLFMKTAIRP